MSQDEQINGAQIAAAILNRMSPERKARLLQRIESVDPSVATRIQSNLFGVNDIPSLTSQSVQALLREIDRRDLVLSMRSATPEIQGAILEHMPQRAQEVVREELASLSQASEREAQEAQSRLIAKMEELRSQGKIRGQAKNETWA